MISDNVHHLIETLRACCSSENSENKITDLSLDSMTLLSLLLIQFVSPDVMYNGLPWPDEEFSKVVNINIDNNRVDKCLFVVGDNRT